MKAAFGPGPHRLAEGRLRRPRGAEVGALADWVAAMDPWRRLGIGAAALALYLDRRDPSLHRFVLDRGGTAEGVLALRWPWLRGPFIELLAVAPALQGAGLGRAVVAWAAEAARPVARNLWASAADFNGRARRFWAGQGFVEVAPLAGLIADDGCEILLRRRLDDADVSARRAGARDT